MPQWAGSCWYYLRFLDPRNDERPFSEEAYDAWMPVDLYVGGGEHAVLHLLYARFWHKVLFDLGIVKHKEPFTKLVHQGVILGENNEKMSKARGNVVNPDDVVKSHGADSLRVYEMFMGPLEQVKPWQMAGIEGVRRFLDRVWNVTTGALTDDPKAYDDATKRLVHKTVKKVGEDIEALHFNTAISAMMILVKHLGGLPAVPREAAREFALIVSPFAPHLGEELWERLGGKASLAYEPWPSFDPALVKDDVVEIGVQVNGKVRGTITLAVAADQETALAAAHATPNVASHVAGKTVKKVVYVPGKILNLIVG
jgi:leucyl-tRNA synthetase